VLLVEEGRAEEGLAILHDARDRLERQLGALSPMVGRARMDLGEALLALGRLDEAAAEHRAAAAALEDEPLDRAHALVGVATAERRRGRPAEALIHDQEALEVRLRLLAEDDVDVAFARLAVAYDHLALGAPRDALPLAEAALAVLAAGEPAGRALAQWGVARALLGTGGDRARVRALAGEVLAAMAATPRLDAELTAARAAIERAARY
jgi:tetratricopeptide (TPR) repeat protein